MLAEHPTPRRQHLLRELRRLALEPGCHGVVPTVEIAEERAHGDELHDLFVIEVLPERLKVLGGRF